MTPSRRCFFDSRSLHSVGESGIPVYDGGTSASRASLRSCKQCYLGRIAAVVTRRVLVVILTWDGQVRWYRQLDSYIVDEKAVTLQSLKVVGALIDNTN